MVKSAGTRVQSVARAAKVLLAAAARDGVGPTEAAAAAGCSVPAAHHLLSTLRDEGLLVQNARRRFVIGPAAAVLAEAWGRSDRVPEFLLRALRELASGTGETAYLAVWRNDAIRVIAALDGSQAVRVAGTELGPYEHPHARATGKLLLAFADAGRRRAALGDPPYEALTPQTTTDPARLADELERIRTAGWSEDHEEFAAGVSCVAAPVIVAGVVVASLCVSAPTLRFTAGEAALRDAVLRAAAVAAHGDRAQITEETA